jgi:hypothetical protein
MRRMPSPRRAAGLLVLALVAACQKDDAKQPPAPSPATVPGDRTGEPGVAPIDSADILARGDIAEEADVKHVLLAWKDLGATYGGRLDPRAAERSHAEAAALAQQLAGRLRADPATIDALVKEHSEDPGSLGGDPYTVTADAPFVPEFKNLALRLRVGEVGIVRTDFGYHVMVRVEPPPPDPLESSDIMARPAGTGTRQVQHVLIGWKDVPAARQRPLDPRAAGRSKEEADRLASEILARVRGGAAMTEEMKVHSEDPGSKDSGRAYEVSAGARLVEPFKRLSMRLEVGEAGLVQSVFGWHVIQRIE